MANNLVLAEASRLLGASLGVAAYTAPTLPMKLALQTVTGTNITTGTDVAGGSYAPQSVTFAAVTVSGGVASTSNTATVTFTALPAAIVAGVEVRDSAATPRRAWVGPLTNSRQVAAGDSLSFPVGAIVPSLG